MLFVPTMARQRQICKKKIWMSLELCYSVIPLLGKFKNLNKSLGNKV